MVSRSVTLFYLRLKGRVCWKWSIWSSSLGAPRAEEARESTTNTQKHFIIDRIWVSGIIVRPRLCLFSTRVELRRWATQVMSSAGRAQLLALNSARNHFSCSSPADTRQPTAIYQILYKWHFFFLLPFWFTAYHIIMGIWRVENTFC